MAAYSAVVSLLQSLENFSPPVHLSPQIESLREDVSFLQHSLENSSQNASIQVIFDGGLEAKIRDAVFKAEDLIESKIANLSVHEVDVHAKETYKDSALVPKFMSFLGTGIAMFTSIKHHLHRSVKRLGVGGGLIFNSRCFCGGTVTESESQSRNMTNVVPDVQCHSLTEDEDLGNIIEEIGYIVEELKKVKDSLPGNFDEADGRQQPTRKHRSAASSSSSGGKFSIGSGRNVVWGFEKYVEQTRSRLYDDSLKLDIVSIVGMGGIGKTTLARRAFDDSCFDHHFDIRAWTTVSQEYSLRKVLVSLLDSGKMFTEKMHGMKEQELAENLYKNLMGRRYLIVIDDVWDDDIWDVLRTYFPDDNNSSRVLLTTRLSKVGQHANPHSPLCWMSVLNKDDSWNLFCNEVFGENDCPMELESIGKEITGNCKGLPLAIAVTGGFLSKVSRTEEDWTSVAENLSCVVAKDDEECMEILSLSYKQLPHHLRPCFLYMAMFPKDYMIPVLLLVRLWAAEGFLKPGSKSKSPEALAEECLEDLIERNLILVCERNLRGKIKTCKIHDMLWNFCVQRAQKEKFLHAVKCSDDVILPEDTGAPRRCSLHLSYHSGQPEILFDIITRDSSIHSLICSGAQTIHSPEIYLGRHMLLRVLDLVIVQLIHFPDVITQFANLRYLAITYNGALPPTISRLQNLETLVHGQLGSYRQWHFLPVEIWLMPKLRHLWVMPGCLIDPLGTQFRMEDISCLQNLQTLIAVRNLRCTSDILRRMPNLRELWIVYDGRASKVWSYYELESLANLHQLEILHLFMDNSYRPSRTCLQLPAGFTFPQMLYSLTLSGCEIPWQSMTIVASLPCLEVLVLRRNACQGAEWEPNVEEFGQLTYLRLERLDDLTQWEADKMHFPCLQRLIIWSCHGLQEISSGIGNIPTLEEITLVDCHPLAVASAKRIQKEQEDMGNEDLRVVIKNNKERKV